MYERDTCATLSVRVCVCTCYSLSLDLPVSVSTAEIVIAPDSSEVDAGNTAIFTCVGLSDPPPNITWTFNGDVLSNDSTISVYTQLVNQGGTVFVLSMLELCGATEKSSGLYACVATDGEGRSTSADFSLFVMQPGKDMYVCT